MSRGAGLGEILRRAREERGLGIEEVRVGAGVPSHYVVAIEEGRSPLVADEVYVIPWLRRYAEFLDLDVPAVVGRFLAEAERADTAAPPIVPLPPERASRMGPWLLIIALAAAAGLLAWWWWTGRLPA